MPRLILLFLLALPLFAQERIVALSPSVSEIVFALNRGDALVGVSDYAAYPEAVKTIEKVGGYFQPNLEKIISLKPTLVIAQAHHNALLKQLEQFDVKTLQVEFFTLDDIRQSIGKIAKALDAGAGGELLVDRIDQAGKEADKAEDDPSVLIVFGAATDLRDGIYVAGHDLYFEEIITICGAHNAFKSDFVGQPSLSIEGVIALDPDRVIIFHSPLTDSAVTPKEAQMKWEQLPIKAAQGKITVMDASHLAIPSHRVAGSIRALCGVIAGD